MKRLVLKSIVAAVAIAAFGVASAQDIKERTIKFGHLNNTDHPVSLGVKRFAELVARVTPDLSRPGQARNHGHLMDALAQGLDPYQPDRAQVDELVRRAQPWRDDVRTAG